MSGRLVESFKVASTLSAYRGVSMLSGSADTVGYPETTTAHLIGVTINDVDDTTQSIAVARNGRAKLLFNDTVAASGLVALDTSGRGIPHSDVTGASYVIGVLSDAAVAATGTIAWVELGVVQRSIP